MSEPHVADDETTSVFFVARFQGHFDKNMEAKTIISSQFQISQKPPATTSIPRPRCDINPQHSGTHSPTDITTPHPTHKPPIPPHKPRP